MKVIKPTTVTPNLIISSSLVETAAAWSSATNYVIGDQVYDGLDGIYQAVTNNHNKQPKNYPLDWSYIKPTNRWAIFDSEINSTSIATNSMTFKLATGAMTGIALLNVDAASVSISIEDRRGWEYVNNLSSTAWGSTASANAIAWTGTQFCVVGDSGKVATSLDGITWTNQTDLSSTAWGSTASANAIAWTGTQLCVVGDNGKVATSPDGVTWTNQTSLSGTTWGSTASVNAIAWTGTQFCVVGDNGKVATSLDGITWVYRGGLITTTWGSTASANAIAWTGTQFCVVGDGGRSATSLDGITWSYQTNLAATSWSTTNARGITWAETQFCVVGNNGKTATSPSGTTPVLIYTGTQNLISIDIIDWYEYFFFDQGTKRTQAVFVELPLLNYTDTYTTVSIVGVGTISAGICTFGKLISIGNTEFGASSGIIDYSAKLTDEFGQTTFVRRAYSKRMSGRVLIPAAQLNTVQRTLYDLRAIPALWLGSQNPNLEEALVVFGYYRDFSTDISYSTYSYCSLEIEGLI